MSNRETHLRAYGYERPELPRGAVWEGPTACRVRGPAPVTATAELVTCKLCVGRLREGVDRARYTHAQEPEERICPECDGTARRPEGGSCSLCRQGVVPAR